MTRQADVLREMRLEKRLTQEEVAHKFKVSQGYYSAIERGLKPREIADAQKVISGMRARTNRTDGGDQKAGRRK